MRSHYRFLCRYLECRYTNLRHEKATPPQQEEEVHGSLQIAQSHSEPIKKARRFRTCVSRVTLAAPYYASCIDNVIVLTGMVVSVEYTIAVTPVIEVNAWVSGQVVALVVMIGACFTILMQIIWGRRMNALGKPFPWEQACWNLPVGGHN